ncbi:MAG: hypothetical protein ACJASV_001571 [Pseudorhodobacter sp.]|jgi:hypothetical protein
MSQILIRADFHHLSRKNAPRKAEQRYEAIKFWFELGDVNRRHPKGQNIKPPALSGPSGKACLLAAKRATVMTEGPQVPKTAIFNGSDTKSTAPSHLKSERIAGAGSDI